MAGGCWRAFGSSGVFRSFVITTCGGIVMNVPSGCCGLRFPSQSSLFRGLSHLILQTDFALRA